MSDTATEQRFVRLEARVGKLEDRQDAHGEQVTAILLSVERLSGRLDALGVKFWAVCAAIGFGSSALTAIGVLLVQRAIGG